MKEFEGKTAVITGGASGIGLGMAQAFAAKGMRLALLDIEAPALDAASKSFDAGVEVKTFVVDVADRAAMADAAAKVAEAFGDVHVLCNNAGVGTADPLQVARPADWDWVLAVNLSGVVNGLLAFLPKMVEHGEPGHIVNTASVAGLHAMSEIGIYNTSKYAVVGMTETLRDDLKETPLGVSALCPGFVNTNINQSRRNRQEQYGESRRPRMSSESMRQIDRALKTRGMAPRDLGDMVVDAVEREILYIVTDPTFWMPIRRRFEEMSGNIVALHGGLPGSE